MTDNDPTSSPTDVAADDSGERVSPWAAPTYAPHAVHAAGRTFTVVATNGVAEAVAEGNTDAAAPNRLDQPDAG